MPKREYNFGAFDPHPEDSATRRTNPSRGAAYWEGQSAVPCGEENSKIDRRLFYITLDAHLVALDPHAGRPCKGFGEGGAIDLRAGVADKWPKGRYDATSPPTIYKDLVITGSEVQEIPSKGPSGMFAPSMSIPVSSFGHSTPSRGPAKLGTARGKVIPGKIVRGPTCGPS